MLLIWARASLIVFALFYTGEMPTVDGFLGQLFSLDNIEFLFAYCCVGGFFAILVFANSVVSVPMMLDRDTDGIVAVLTSSRRFRRTFPRWQSGEARSLQSSGQDLRCIRRAGRCRAGHRARDVACLPRAGWRRANAASRQT